MTKRHQSGADLARPRVPPGHRVYAIGDVHGCDELLQAMLASIQRHADDHPIDTKTLILLGDYVDRGPDPQAVVERVRAWSAPGFQVRHLKGNHEDLMLKFLETGALGEAWLTNGARQTMESYGVPTTEILASLGDLQHLRLRLAEALPKDHLAFLRSLSVTHEIGDYLFVHAGIRPGVPIDEQSEADCLWIRDHFLNDDRDHGKIVVHGHSISYQPELQANRIGIDTGAFATGRLTCLVLEEDSQEFLTA